MNIAYCGLLLPEEKKLAERSKRRLPGVSLHKLSSALIAGLDHNLDKPVNVFSIINTLNYPKFPDLIFKNEQWQHTTGADDWYIGYINLFGIKYITQKNNLYQKLKAWKKQLHGEHCIICVHHIYYPFMAAACRLKRKDKQRVTICLITGDMNGRFGLTAQSKPNLKQRLTRFLEKRIDKMAKEFDCFVFATKDMAEGFGVTDRPFTVLECTYIDPLYTMETDPGIHQKNGQKILFYAGSLRKEYGIAHLLRAFSQINDPDYRLWLAGGGDTEMIIQEYAAKDPRVELLGFISPQEVERRQRLATALISPRTGELEFVKYSFPSKTMECLASGKPYIAHKLPCDPPEYADYIQYAEDESDEALRDKIVEICERTAEERNAIGERAKQFIVREKNPTVMCRRIVTMWEEMIVSKKGY